MAVIGAELGSELYTHVTHTEAFILIMVPSVLEIEPKLLGVFLAGTAMTS